MKILIIGGNSYIARSFIARYGDQFHCTVLKRDESIRDYFDLNTNSFGGYDAIINCAAIVHNHHPDESLAKKINTDLPVYLAKLSKEGGIPHFIHLSSIAVYGTATNISDTTQELPVTIYGKTKLAGDQNLLSLEDPTFHIAVIRAPMVYGPEAPGNLQSLIRLIQNIPILPFGYTKNRRSMIYIDNLLTAIEKILIKKADGVFLVRDEQLPSLDELCRNIAISLKLKRLFVSLPENFIRILCRFSFLPFSKLYGSLIIDDTFTRHIIGEYASVPLKEALQKTIGKSAQ